MPERLECEVLQKARYINTLALPFYCMCARARLYFNVQFLEQIKNDDDDDDDDASRLIQCRRYHRRHWNTNSTYAYNIKEFASQRLKENKYTTRNEEHRSCEAE